MSAATACGPKTPEGKIRSSQNSLKHGLFSEQALLPGEDAAAYEALGARLTATLKPATPEEETLVRTIQDSQWRLERCTLLEDACWFTSAHEQTAAAQQLLGTTDAGDMRVAALSRFLGFRSNSRLFDQIHRQQGRLIRLIDKTHAELKRSAQFRVEQAKLQRLRVVTTLSPAGLLENLQNEPTPEPAPSKPEKNLQNEPSQDSADALLAELDAAYGLLPEENEQNEPTPHNPAPHPSRKMPKFTGRKAARKRAAWLQKHGEPAA